MITYHSTTEAAAILNISMSTLYRLLYTGQLKASKLNGKNWRISSEAIEELMRPINADHIKLPKKETQKNGQE